MRTFFSKVQSESSVQRMNKKDFLIDNHCKTISESEVRTLPTRCFGKTHIPNRDFREILLRVYFSKFCWFSNTKTDRNLIQKESCFTVLVFHKHVQNWQFVHYCHYSIPIYFQFPFLFVPFNVNKCETSMHSSRMCTARLLTGGVLA